MQVFDAKSYVDFMSVLVSDGKDIRPKRGTIKEVAKTIKCHPTYISQILRSKAHLNNEQALRLCKMYAMPEEDTDYFLDLVARDRAGDKVTVRFFQRRLDQKKRDRLDIKKRWNTGEKLSADQQAQYYENWIPQAVHMLCQLPGEHTVRSISQRLLVPEERINAVLQNLTNMSILRFDAGVYHSEVESLHLGKDSKYAQRAHMNWRLKTSFDLMTAPRDVGTHFSSLVTTSETTAKQIRELIFKHLTESREHILGSKEENLYVYAIDFYPITSS
jgi:hypothetical protein